jgi:hypothetical protein
MRSIALYLAAVSLFFVGCRGNSLPPETDASQGRAAIKTVLDTWAKGGNFADLKNGNPAIVAYDPDWEAGNKLTKYEIDPADKRIGVDLLLRVTLSLKKADGKAQDKTVNFSVAIGPQTVVLRKE